MQENNKTNGPKVLCCFMLPICQLSLRVDTKRYYGECAGWGARGLCREVVSATAAITSWRPSTVREEPWRLRETGGRPPRNEPSAADCFKKMDWKRRVSLQGLAPELSARTIRSVICWRMNVANLVFPSVSREVLNISGPNN